MRDFLIYAEEYCYYTPSSKVLIGHNTEYLMREKQIPFENIILSKLRMGWGADENLVGDPAYQGLVVCFNPDLLGITDANRAMPILRLLADKLSVFVMKPFQYFYEGRKFANYKSLVDYLQNTYGENWKERNIKPGEIEDYAYCKKDEMFTNFENNFWRLKSHSTDEEVDTVENIFAKQEIEIKEYSAVTEYLVDLWKLRNTPCIDGMTLFQKRILKDFFTTDVKNINTYGLIARADSPYPDLFVYVNDRPKMSDINLMLKVMPRPTSLKQHSSVEKSKLFDLIFKSNDIPLKKLSDNLFLNLDTIYIPLTMPFSHVGRDSFGTIYNRPVIKTIDYIKHCLNGTVTDEIRMDLNKSIFFKNSLILYNEKARSFYAVGVLEKREFSTFKVISMPYQLTDTEFMRTLDELQDQQVLTYYYRQFPSNYQNFKITFSNRNITIPQASSILGLVKELPKEKFTFIGLDDTKTTVDSFTSYLDKFIEHRLEYYQKRLDLEGLTGQSPFETWIQELDALRDAVLDSDDAQHDEYFNKALAKFNFSSLLI